MSLLKLTISERQRGGVKENKVEFLHHLLNLKKSQSPQYSALSFVLENLKRQKQDLTLCETQPLMNCRLVYYSWSWNNLKDIPFFYPPLLSHPQGWRVFELGGGGVEVAFFTKADTIWNLNLSTLTLFVWVSTYWTKTLISCIKNNFQRLTHKSRWIVLTRIQFSFHKNIPKKVLNDDFVS